MKTLRCNNHVNSFDRESGKSGDDIYQVEISDRPAGFLAAKYTFVYDYPLRRPASFSHDITNNTSLVDILLLASADYKEIYRREDESAGPTGNVPGMLNRNSSRGPYGIWGHHIDDLFFESVTVDEKNFTVSFGIGS